MDDCIFCQIVWGEAPADIVETNDMWHEIEWTAFRPLEPHAPGHVMFVPNRHIEDAAEDPLLASKVFWAASRYVMGWNLDANIITSVGAPATQSVFHLHIHVIPRGVDDGLPERWPWIK